MLRICSRTKAIGLRYAQRCDRPVYAYPAIGSRLGFIFVTVLRLRDMLSTIRWYTVNMWRYMFPGRRERGKYGKIAYFDLRENRFHRYLLNFMHILQLQDHAIVLRHRPRAIGTWATSQLLEQLPSLRFHWKDTPVDATLYFSDHIRGKPFIQLDPHYFGIKPTERNYVLPMGMMSSQYEHGFHDWIPDIVMPRKRQLFFVGNLDEAHYGSNDLMELFGCYPRNHLISLIKQHFPERVYIPSSAKDLSKKDGRDLILVDRSKYYIHAVRLRTVLAQYDLFLAASGVIMPLCHNLIEAMSVGTIPVLQHAHLMVPPLIHGKNCLSFTNESELIALIKDFPKIEENEIRRMRAEVMDHYFTHLSPEAVVGQISGNRSLDRIHMNAEHLSVELLRKQLRNTSTPFNDDKASPQ